jgi:hypothetical protein
MNINRIALFLDGVFPPYYREPLSRLKLIRLVRAHTKLQQSTVDDLLTIIDSKNFFVECLKSVEEVDEIGLKKLIKLLDVPEDAGGISKKDLISEELQKLKEELEKMKSMKSGEEQKRGTIFQDWVCKLFDVFGLKTRDPDKSGVNQFDGAAELDGNNYLIESKWKDDTNKNDVFLLGGKVEKTRLIGTLGLFVFNEVDLGKEKLSNMITTAQEAKNVLLLQIKDIEKVLNQDIGLDDLIRTLKRSAAEEGKPFLD